MPLSISGTSFNFTLYPICILGVFNFPPKDLLTKVKSFYLEGESLSVYCKFLMTNRVTQLSK